MTWFLQVTAHRSFKISPAMAQLTQLPRREQMRQVQVGLLQLSSLIAGLRRVYKAVTLVQLSKSCPV